MLNLCQRDSLKFKEHGIVEKRTFAPETGLFFRPDNFSPGGMTKKPRNSPIRCVL